MSNKRFGPADGKGIKAVDVNLGAFASYKTVDDLKKEPGKIFGHLQPAAQDAAYEELAAELGIGKAAAAKPAVTTPA
jgi:hypothetical protein